MSSHSRIKKSGTSIIGPIFFDRTVNTEVYMNIFLRILCSNDRRKETELFLPAGRGDMPHFSGVPAASS
jgi:hypothetical protein